jgi:hypothetical protein
MLSARLDCLQEGFCLARVPSKLGELLTKLRHPGTATIWPSRGLVAPAANLVFVRKQNGRGGAIRRPTS